MTNQAIARLKNQSVAEAGATTVKQFFETRKSQLAEVLPQHVTPERMLNLAIGALRTTPKLRECRIDSLFGALVKAASLGLEPNTPMGHCYLVPFRDKRDGMVVQLIPGYKGLVDLARRSGKILSISARVVYTDEPFEVEYGTNEYLKHTPTHQDGVDDDIVAAYAVAHLVGGGYQFEAMWRHGLIAVRNQSQGAWYGRGDQRRPNLKSPWFAHFPAMCRKTVIRRLYNYLPTSIEMAAMQQLDVVHDQGQSQHLDAVLEGHADIVEDETFDYSDAQPEIETVEPPEETKKTVLHRWVDWIHSLNLEQLTPELWEETEKLTDEDNLRLNVQTLFSSRREELTEQKMKEQSNES